MWICRACPVPVALLSSQCTSIANTQPIEATIVIQSSTGWRAAAVKLMYRYALFVDLQPFENSLISNAPARFAVIAFNIDALPHTKMFRQVRFSAAPCGFVHHAFRHFTGRARTFLHFLASERT